MQNKKINKTQVTTKPHLQSVIRLYVYFTDERNGHILTCVKYKGISIFITQCDKTYIMRII